MVNRCTKLENVFIWMVKYNGMSFCNIEVRPTDIPTHRRRVSRTHGTDHDNTLLIWVNYIPGINKQCLVKCGMKLCIHPQTTTVEALGWISSFIQHFIMGVITYPFWD